MISLFAIKLKNSYWISPRIIRIRIYPESGLIIFPCFQYDVINGYHNWITNLISNSQFYFKKKKSWAAQTFLKNSFYLFFLKSESTNSFRLKICKLSFFAYSDILYRDFKLIRGFLLRLPPFRVPLNFVMAKKWFSYFCVNSFAWIKCVLTGRPVKDQHEFQRGIWIKLSAWRAWFIPSSSSSLLWYVNLPACSIILTSAFLIYCLLYVSKATEAGFSIHSMWSTERPNTISP